MFWNRTFLKFTYPRFSESIISEVLKLWGPSLFSKYSKIYANFGNTTKFDKKTFAFDIIVLWRKNLSRTVNVLRNSPRILNPTKWEFFQINMSQNDEAIGWKCCRGNLSNAFHPLTPWLPKGVLKQDLFDMSLGFLKKEKMFKSTKYFLFLRYCFSFRCRKFSILWRKHFSLTVIVLMDSPRISGATKRDVL